VDVERRAALTSDVPGQDQPSVSVASDCKSRGDLGLGHGPRVGIGDLAGQIEHLADVLEGGK
jgi:hypothetical protein